MSPETPSIEPSGEPTPAWEQFVEGLRGFVRRRVPAQDAEDVAQEALLRLHERVHRLRDPGRLRSWVFAIARHTVADYYRRRDPLAGERLEPVEVEDPAAAVDEHLGRFPGDHSVHEEVLTWLRPTAEQLPPHYRDAILLADFEGVPQADVAERLGLSVPGAKSRIQRARRLLAAELARCCTIELGSDGRVEDFERHDACDC